MRISGVLESREAIGWRAGLSAPIKKFEKWNEIVIVKNK